eukprot:1673974-Pyramimonas_sp.AAC.1
MTMREMRRQAREEMTRRMLISFAPSPSSPPCAQDPETDRWVGISADEYKVKRHGAVLPERGRVELLGVKVHLALVDKDACRGGGLRLRR